MGERVRTKTPAKKHQTPPSSEQALNPPPLSQKEEFIQTIEKQKLSLLDKRECPQGEGVRTKTPAKKQTITNYPQKDSFRWDRPIQQLQGL